MRKSIKRATQESARAAMAQHVEKMKATGWAVEQEFEGSAGFKFECITYFSKSPTAKSITEARKKA
jgi:hypothetical protein